MSILKKLDKTYIAGTYNRFPVEIVSGKGSLLYDDTGKEYLEINECLICLIEVYLVRNEKFSTNQRYEGFSFY